VRTSVVEQGRSFGDVDELSRSERFVVTVTSLRAV
jgi:hypothetical protein